MKIFNRFIPQFIKKSEFGINTLLYSSSSFITGGLGFILVTILTRILTKEDFGVFENFSAIMALLTGVILWGNDNNLIQYYKEGSKKTEYFQAISVILCQFIILLVLSFFINLSFVKVDRLVVIAAVILSTITALSQIINISFQYEKDAKKYSLIAVSGAVLGLIINVSIVYITKNYWGRIVAVLLTGMIMFVIVLIPFRKQKLQSFSINFGYIKSAYIIGLPFIVGLVAGWAMEKANRIMITNMLSLNEAGIFGVGYQFGSIVLIIKAAITRAWMPYIIDNGKDKKNLVAKMIPRLILSFAILSLFVSIASYFYIDFFINKSFIRAQYIVPIIAFSYFFDGIWSLYVNIIVFEKKYKIYTTITIIAGIINVFLNYIFIPKFGIIGSAFSTLISFGIGGLLSFLYVKYILKWFKT